MIKRRDQRSNKTSRRGHRDFVQRSVAILRFLVHDNRINKFFDFRFSRVSNVPFVDSLRSIVAAENTRYLCFTETKLDSNTYGIPCVIHRSDVTRTMQQTGYYFFLLLLKILLPTLLTIPRRPFASSLGWFDRTPIESRAFHLLQP